jgi:hypothetical protein
VPTVTGVCARRPSCTRGGVALARTGSPQRTVDDERGRRCPRKSGAGRVSPSRAAAPAQASARLWAPGAQHPTSSKTSTHAQSQRYCARGPSARLGVILRFLCWCLWRATTQATAASAAGMRSCWGGRGRASMCEGRRGSPVSVRVWAQEGYQKFASWQKHSLC